MGNFYSENSIQRRMLLDFQILVGWLFIIPISFFIPKKKKLTIVIGKENGLFADNTKYFFIYSQSKGNVFFLTEDETTFNTLLQNGITNVLLYPSLKSIFFLLRTQYLVVDNVKWIYNYKYFFLLFSKKIQLWHGIGSKHIELDNTYFKKKKHKYIAYIKGVLIGTYPYYDYIISTSDYYIENVFKNAFRHKIILNLGQPRNDIFFRIPDKLDLINVDKHVFDIISKKKEEAYKIILYTPTFRDMGGNILSDNAINFKNFDDFCKENKIIIIIKQHPYASDFEMAHYSHIFVCNKLSDIYPLMSLSDIMITDYSSIYLDFILIDKPIIFYLYDYKKYITQDRELRSDFLEITPGPKCYTQEDLEREIINNLNEDNYKTKRIEIIDLSYQNKDGDSSKRIYQHIIDVF